jgi:hypothetical protein
VCGKQAHTEKETHKNVLAQMISMHLLEWTQIYKQTTDHTKYRQVCELLEVSTLLIGSWYCKMVQLLWKTVGHMFIRLKTHLTI